MKKRARNLKIVGGLLLLFFFISLGGSVYRTARNKPAMVYWQISAIIGLIGDGIYVWGMILDKKDRKEKERADALIANIGID